MPHDDRTFSMTVYCIARYECFNGNAALKRGVNILQLPNSPKYDSDRFRGINTFDTE
jgi:hypothetical protein